MLELKEQVEEVRERQERLSTAEPNSTSTSAGKGSYKVPTDISALSYYWHLIRVLFYSWQ